jgi:hypothetical protein
MIFYLSLLLILKEDSFKGKKFIKKNHGHIFNFYTWFYSNLIPK